MGKPFEKALVIRQSHLLQGFPQALLPRRTGQLRRMGRQGFVQLPEDAQRRVKRHRRVLGDIGDQTATGFAQRFAMQTQHVGTRDNHPPIRELRALAHMA